MVEEARIEETESGLAPVTDGWFVMNVRDAAWLANDTFGAACIFESDEAPWPHLGVTLGVLQPGRPSGMYHAESDQEDFLVLSGECLLLVEGEERPLKAGDLVHCPPGTAHIFVGAGDGPCVIFMVGSRVEPRSLVYPRSELALRHGAGVEAEVTSGREAYADSPKWRAERPEAVDRLPWRI